MSGGRGSTFDGLIAEIPGVAADRFNCDASIYLLSHHHTDHTVGLRNLRFHKRVFCSEGTKRLLQTNETYSRVQHLIRPLEYNRQYTLNVDQGGSTKLVVVTLIPSYHCPGSCMFLIEQNGISVLYTGDIRAEDWWIHSLPYNQFLHPYTSTRKLDCIYIDTSFAYRGEPYAKYATNADAIRILAAIVKLYPLDDPEIQFYFHDGISGLDECWVKLAYELGLEIHADEANSKILKVASSTSTVPPYGAPDSFAYTINGYSSPKTTKLHACGRYWQCSEKRAKFPVAINQYSDFNVVDFAAASMPLRLDMIHKTDKEGLKLVDETKMGNQIYNFKNRLWLLSADKSELLPGDLKLLFSRHSSYGETCNLLRLFKPREVIPCCESKQTWVNGFTMSRTFGEVCAPNMRSRYDELLKEKYCSPPAEILRREVKQVNRWSSAECEKERQFVAGFYSKLDQNPGAGKLLAMEHTNDYRSNTYNGKAVTLPKGFDFQVEDLVTGRREKWYSEFIESCQNTYFEMLQYAELSGSKRDVHSSSMEGLSESGSDMVGSYETSFKESPQKRVCLVRRKSAHTRIRLRSMVSSSFDSFERSFSEETAANDNHVLFRTSSKYSTETVARVRDRLHGAPEHWKRSPLTTIA